MTKLGRDILKLFMVILILIWGQVHAKKVVLRMEMPNSKMMEQMAMIVDTKSTTLVRNSNFFCLPSKKVRLGHFRIKRSKKLNLARREIKLIMNRFISLPMNLPIIVKPEATRYYLNNHNVTNRSILAGSIERILKSFCNSKEWIPVDAVELTLKKKEGQRYIVKTQLKGRKGKGKVSTKSAKNCVPSKPAHQKMSNTWECLDKDFGLAILIDPLG